MDEYSMNGYTTERVMRTFRGDGLEEKLKTTPIKQESTIAPHVLEHEEYMTLLKEIVDLKKEIQELKDKLQVKE